MKYSGNASAVVLALLLPLAASRAQTASKEEPPKWSFSLGADPTAFDLRTRDPGVEARLVANLARTWQAPGSRFTRQVSLMMGADAPRSQENCYGCWERVGKRYAGLTAGGSMDLFHVSRFTPYIQSGAGIYYTKLTGNVNGALQTWSPIYDQSRFSFGINGGLGLKARLGSHEFFVEQILHAFDVSPSRIDKGVYPLNFGIKF